MGEPIIGFVRYADADGNIRLRAEDTRHSRIVFDGIVDARSLRVAANAMCDRLPVTLVTRPDGSWKVEG